MAFKMSPIGKKKCSYSPMQKKGLISPIALKTKYYGEPGENTKVTVTKTPTATGFNEETKEVKTVVPFANKPKVSMQEAYKNRDMNAYGNLSFPEYEKEALSQLKPKVTTNVTNRVVDNKQEEQPNTKQEVDYSYLDGLAQTHGYKAGDGLQYGTQISSTVGSTLRGSEDPMSREMTQLEADYLNKKAGKIIYGGPMSNLNKNKTKKNTAKPIVNRVIRASF
jgi:hypothetical protein